VDFQGTGQTSEILMETLSNSSVSGNSDFDGEIQKAPTTSSVLFVIEPWSACEAMSSNDL